MQNGYCSPSESCAGLRELRSHGSVILTNVGGERANVLRFPQNTRNGIVFNFCPFCGEHLRIVDGAAEVVDGVLRMIGLKE